MVFLDEAGFMLTPTVRRTLAPRGKTPVLAALQRHDRISAISCVTLGVKAEQPGLYFELMPEGLNVTAEDIVTKSKVHAPAAAHDLIEALHHASPKRNPS